MINEKLLKKSILSLSFLLLASPVHAFCEWGKYPRHPFYVGISGGYGQTTWGMLVPDEPNMALESATPISVTEGGGLIGAYAGYEILNTFAFEASYMRYPDAQLTFGPTSWFVFDHNGQNEFTTHTESVSLVAKLMVLIPHTPLRGYASFGAAGVHRFDEIANRWRASPTFGAGINCLLTDYLMAEFGTEYVAGYGQSEVDPAEHYIPFLYSGFARLAYRFG